MSRKIFISYRRDDTLDFSILLRDQLKKQLRKDGIFIDIRNLEPGIEFAEEIKQKVASCDALLAVIGGRWLSPRLHEPEDFVCLEIATALERKIRVIPVLVNGASMPNPGDLPDILKSLAKFHAVEIRSSRIEPDVEELITFLKGHSKKTAAEQLERERQALYQFVPPKRIIALVAMAALLVVGLVYVAILMLHWIGR